MTEVSLVIPFSVIYVTLLGSSLVIEHDQSSATPEEVRRDVYLYYFLIQIWKEEIYFRDLVFNSEQAKVSKS